MPWLADSGKGLKCLSGVREEAEGGKGTVFRSGCMAQT